MTFVYVFALSLQYETTDKKWTYLVVTDKERRLVYNFFLLLPTSNNIVKFSPNYSLLLFISRVVWSLRKKNRVIKGNVERLIFLCFSLFSFLYERQLTAKFADISLCCSDVTFVPLG